MQITLRLFRFNPETGQTKPRYDNFTLDAEPTDRILDLLEEVKAHHDPTLSFRRSCAHGVCGSDAMRINGRNMLACKALVKDFNSTTITVEPILGLRVLKDFIVDMEPFLDSYKSILPYMVAEKRPEDGREHLQSIEQRERFDNTTKCILCAACTTSCPSYWASDEYYGPAALVTAHRFVFDSRDEGASQRLQILSDTNGTVRCHTAYNCTNACPRDIQITKAIGELKLAMVTGKLD